MNGILAGIAFMILGGILLFFATAVHAADPYLVLGGGVTQFNSYASDPAHDNARFCDNGFECDAKTGSRAWQIGAGLNFKKPLLGLHWAAEAYYADFGTMRLNSQFPPDSNYNVTTHSCDGACSPADLYSFKGNWRARGPVIALLPAYRWRDFGIYGKTGIAMMFIDGSAYVAQPNSTTFVKCEGCKEIATRYGPVVGVGISYEGFPQVKPFLEFTHTDTFGGGFPGFQSWQSFLVGIRIPLN